MKTSVLESLKEETGAGVSPEDFLKFVRKPFLQETLQWLLPSICLWTTKIQYNTDDNTDDNTAFASSGIQVLYKIESISEKLT